MHIGLLEQKSRIVGLSKVKGPFQKSNRLLIGFRWISKLVLAKVEDASPNSPWSHSANRKPNYFWDQAQT